MSWPNTVSLVTGSVGDALGSSGESADRIYVAVTPVFGEDVHRLLHADTGTVWDDRAVVQSGAPTLFVQVPHVDQEGFVDGAGNAVTDWYYLVQVITRTGTAKAQWSYLWQPRVADGNTIDLDTLGDGVLVTDPVLVYTPALDAAEAREAAAQALAAAQEAEEWGTAAAGSASAAAGSASASEVSAQDAATSVTDALAAVSDAESSMTAAEDAATLASGSATAAAGSASAAAGSASGAATSASSASGSASAAAGSASAAAGSATAAGTSASSASGAATAAAGSAATAAASTFTALSSVAKATPGLLAPHIVRDPRPVLFRETDGSLNAWEIGVRVGRARWLCMQLRETIGASGHMVTQVRKIRLRTVGVEYETDGTSAEVTTVGTWTTVSTGSAHGGSAVYSRVATDRKRYTTQAGDILATFRVAIGSNGGYSRIVIDGDDTRATGGVTVQSEMDAGRVTDATRVAQGWSVNTRLINHYAAGALTYNNYVTVVDDLDGAPGHTIDFMPTGVKPAASSDTRAYIDTITNGKDGTGSEFAASTTRPVVRVLFDMSSTIEYAVHPTPFDNPTGWVGGSHGYDQQTGLTAYVDGKAQVSNGAAYSSGGLANLAGVTGDTILAVRKSSLLDPANPTTVIGNAVVRYAVSTLGISIDRAIVWPFGATLTPESYSAMFALNTSYSEVRNVALPGKVSATALDGTMKANGRGDTMWAWEPGGKVAAMMHLPDPVGTARNFPGAGALSYQDRTDGIKKMYALLADAGAPLVIPAGGITRWSSVYGAAVLGDAESVLG